MPLTTPRFHVLTVADRRAEGEDAVSLSFAVPEGLAGAYAFRAGQYLTLRATVDGEALRRSYSISSGEADGELRIGIKRVPDGVFSRWAHEALVPGSTVEVMTPTGRFGVPAAAEAGGLHVGIAAGSGITPVLSVLRTVLARDEAAGAVLFYGSRATGQIMFRGALEDMKDRHMGRLSVVHILSQERQDVDVLNGRLDREKLGLLLRRTLGGAAVAAAYVCGPEGMIGAAEAALLAAGVPAERIQAERFHSALAGRPRRSERPLAAAAEAPHAVATIVLDGKSQAVPVAEGETVLDAAIRAGLDLPFSCKGGMCSTCRAKVTAGAVTMAVNYSLEPWEVAAGFVLTCQSRPVGAAVEVDYDRP